MKNNKKHTFAVCAYKESPYLENCIRSLLKQTALSQSSILIATSTPNQHIERIASKYRIPWYVNMGEGGITQDWNYAYSLADTEYVTITHQDDIYDPEFLTMQLKALEGAKKPLIGFTDYYEIRDGRKCPHEHILKVKRLMLMPLLVKPFQSSVWVRRRILSFGSPLCCPSVTFVKKNLPGVIFENHYRACEDWEAWEKLSRCSGEFVFIPRLLMGHRIHEDSETSAIIQDHGRTAEEMEMFRKFWPAPVAGIVEKYYSRSQKSNQL